MSQDAVETPLSKAALKVIADLEAVKTLPPAERQQWLKDNREQLTMLMLVVKGALADEEDRTTR